MFISIVANNQKGSLARIAVILQRNGFTIEAQKHKALDSGSVVYAFLIRGDSFTPLFIHLEALPYVHKVTTEFAIEDQPEALNTFLEKSTSQHSGETALQTLAEQPELLERIFQ